MVVTLLFHLFEGDSTRSCITNCHIDAVQAPSEEWSAKVHSAKWLNQTWAIFIAMIPKDRNEMARVCVPTKKSEMFFTRFRMIHSALWPSNTMVSSLSNAVVNCWTGGIQSHQLMQVGTSILAEHHHMISILHTPGMGLHLHVAEPTCHI